MTTDVTSTPPSDLKTGYSWSAGIGVLLILLGIAAIAFPNFSTLAAEIWIAWLIFFGGVGKLGYAIQTRKDSGFVWKLLLALLYIGTSVFLLIYPLQGILSLTLVLGVFLLTEGVFETILAFRMRPAANWGWSLANGITTLLLGGLIWFAWPVNSVFAIGLLVGISLLFSGFSRLMLALAARDSLKQVPQA